MSLKTTKLSQKDYLKKYLAGKVDGKKKKKKEKSGVDPSSAKTKIIDDDVDISQLRPLDSSELDNFDVAEDAPQVAGIIDERPAELKAKEQYTSQKWKVLTDPLMGDVQGVVETSSNNSQSELGRNKRDRSPDEAQLLAIEAKRLEEIREKEAESRHGKDREKEAESRHGKDKHKKHKKHTSKEVDKNAPSMDEETYDKTVLQKEAAIERAALLAKEEEQRKHLEKYQKWGKGVKQLEDRKEQLMEQQHEMEKPLARYADDQDLDKHLKDQEREGDPMLEYLRSKKAKDKKAKGVSDKPKYQGPWEPNRYNIPPGYRWDGVDRSSGYEKKWFETQNARKAAEEEAYKWGSEDL